MVASLYLGIENWVSETNNQLYLGILVPLDIFATD